MIKIPWGRAFLGTLCLIYVQVANASDWREALYGATPEQCAKAKLDKPEKEFLHCEEKYFALPQEMNPFEQLEKYFSKDSEAEEAKLDAQFEILLLRKLADKRAAKILEAISEFGLLEVDDPQKLQSIYEALPKSCLNSFPSLKEKYEEHLKLMGKIDKQVLEDNKALRFNQVLEHLSYLRQLKLNKNSISLKRQNRALSPQERKELEEASKLIDQLMENLRLSEPLLDTLAIKNLLSQPKYSSALDKPEDYLSNPQLKEALNQALRSGAKESRQKLTDKEGLGLNYLCSTMKGDSRDFTEQRFARGVKEAEFIDSLLMDEEALNEMTSTKDLERESKGNKEEAIKQLSYRSLLSSASCRLKLKVLNTQSVDLARNFALNSALTIASGGLSSVATGVSVGGKVLIAAKTGRNARLAYYSLAAVDTAALVTVGAPKLYDECIKGERPTGQYFTQKEYSVSSCALSVGLVAVSGYFIKMDLKPIKALKQAEDLVLKGRGFQQGLKKNPEFALQVEKANKSLESLSKEEILSKASLLSQSKVTSLDEGKQILVNSELAQGASEINKQFLVENYLQSLGYLKKGQKLPADFSKTLKTISAQGAMSPVAKKELLEESLGALGAEKNLAEQLVRSGLLGGSKPLNSLQLLKNELGEFRFTQIDDVKSEAFLTRFKSKASEADDTTLFFSAENAVQKKLNDTYIADKGLVDTLNDRYKQILFDTINKNPKLKSSLIGEYNDYKSLKLAFDKKTFGAQTLNAELARAYKEANNKFNALCKETSLEKLFLKADGTKVGGMVSEPSSWFAAGTFDTVDMASIVSRLARKNFSAQKGLSLIKGSYAKDELKTIALETEALRKQSVAIASKAPGAVKDGMLTEDVVAIIRKAQSRTDKSEVVSYLKEKVGKSFGLKLTDEEAETLNSYYSAADTFSPPVLTGKRVSHQLDKAEGEVISFDYRGIGALNAKANMQALKEWDGKDMGELAKLISKYDKGVTKNLYELRSLTEQSAKSAFKEIEDSLPLAQGKNWAEGKITFSGDDGIFRVPALIKESYLKKFGKELGEQKYAEALERVNSNLTSNLLKSGERADRVRVTSLNAKELGAQGDASKVAQQINKQEQIEKGIRELGLGKIQAEEDFLLAVKSKLDPLGNTTYQVQILNSKNKEAVEKLIQEYASKNGILIHTK